MVSTRFLAFVAPLVFGLFGPGAAWAQASADKAGEVVAIPALSSPLMDLANALSGAEASALNAKLRAFEQRTSGQFAVLVVPTARPEPIEDFSLRVAEAWKLGRKGKDNGVLLIVAMAEKKLRFDVGYGYEGALPDVRAKKIIGEVMAPHFKKGAVGAGVTAGVDAALAYLDKDPANSAWSPSTGNAETDATLIFLLIGALVAAFFARAWIVGGASGIAGFFTMGTWVGAAMIGVGVFVAAWVIQAIIAAVRGNKSNAWGQSGHGGHYGGFGGSSWSGGGSGSGGSSWSGGGGSFGGGGASGGWDSGGDSGGGGDGGGGE